MLAHVFSTSRSVIDAFYHALQDLAGQLSAAAAFLYLEDEQVLTHAQRDDTTSKWQPFLEPTLVLAVQQCVSVAPEVTKILHLDGRGLPSAEQLSPSIFYSQLPVTTLTTGTLSNKLRLVLFDSKKVVLCRGCFFFLVDETALDLIVAQRHEIAVCLDNFLPILEAIHHREVEEISSTIMEGGAQLLAREPAFLFRQLFAAACQHMKVEGASFFLKGTQDDPTTTRLVATYPKELPPHERRGFYHDEMASPTGIVLSLQDDCMIVDVTTFRSRLASAKPTPEVGTVPQWCDITDTNRERCLSYSFYRTPEDLRYLFRCTNSLANNSHYFTILDRLRAHRVVRVLALAHRTMESEYRAMKVFTNVSHEFRQRLTGIRSAARYVSKTLIRRLNDETHEKERLIKLSNVDRTIREIDLMLKRFRYPLPGLEELADEGRPFKPYADLVRPVCEMFREKARDRGLQFAYFGEDQLGLIYASLADWKTVFENLVNNAVKYTLKNSKIQVALAREPVASTRKPVGGGQIIVASESLAIEKDELEQIFNFGYRGRAAIEHTSDGEGIGLALCRYTVERYGGRVDYRAVGKVNIFTVHVPRHLFSPAKMKSTEGSETE